MKQHCGDNAFSDLYYPISNLELVIVVTEAATGGVLWQKVFLGVL